MPRQPQPAPFDGALVVNKPQGKTSHDVVDAVRHLAGFRQVGHLGTLDPLATGVLVLLLGRATRLVRFYSGRRKRYNAGFRFGFATDTYDSDGEAQGPDAAPALDAATLERFAAERIGRFEQMPPAFSAKKIHGRPAYELARKKQVVELKAVEIDWRTKWARSWAAVRILRKSRVRPWANSRSSKRWIWKNWRKPRGAENLPTA
jgi:tRNA pseudouridine55 synthase